MKDLILKHKSLANGFERIQHLRECIVTANRLKESNVSSTFLNDVIERRRVSISRLNTLTNHIIKNY